MARLGREVLAQVDERRGASALDSESFGEMVERIGERMVASWSSTPYRAPDPEGDLADLRKRFALLDIELRELTVRLSQAITNADVRSAQSVSTELAEAMMAARLASMLITSAEYRLDLGESGWSIDRTNLSLAELVALAVMEASQPEPPRPGVTI